MPSTRESGRDRCLAASPVAAPVRIPVSRFAAMIARRAPVSQPKSSTTKYVSPGSRRPGYPVRDLRPKNPASGRIADMTRNTPPLPGTSALARGMTFTDPAACCRNACSRSGTASAIEIACATSESESNNTTAASSRRTFQGTGVQTCDLPGPRATTGLGHRRDRTRRWRPSEASSLREVCPLGESGPG